MDDEQDVLVDATKELVGVGMRDIAVLAERLAGLRRDRQRIEAAEERVEADLLLLMRQHDGLHGVRLSNGDAVRRSWSVRATVTPTPERLREFLADANDFVEEKVSMPKLREAYPTAWEQLGKVKRVEVISVRLAGEKGVES